MFAEIHIAIALLLLSLSAGTFLTMWLSQQNVFCQKSTKVIGALVMILSVLGLLCIGYTSLRRATCRSCHEGGSMNKKMRGEMPFNHPPFPGQMGPGMDKSSDDDKPVMPSH